MHERRTSNLSVAYPFTDSSPALALAFPPSAVVDALLSCDRYPVHVHRIRKTGDRAFEISLSDAQGVFFTGACTVPDADFALVLIDSEEDPRHDLRMVVYAPVFIPWLYGNEDAYFGTDLVFDASAVSPHCERVLSLKALTALPTVEESALPGPIAADVTLKEGYNCDIYPGEDTIGISFAAGAGAGRVPCDEQPGGGVRRALVPDSDGGIVIEGDDCVSVVPVPPSQPGDPWSIVVSDKCQACCSCDDYAAVGRAMVALSRRLCDVHARLDGIRDEFAQAAGRLNDLDRMRTSVSGIRDSIGGHYTAVVTNRGSLPVYPTFISHGISAICRVDHVVIGGSVYIPDSAIHPLNPAVTGVDISGAGYAIEPGGQFQVIVVFSMKNLVTPGYAFPAPTVYASFGMDYTRNSVARYVNAGAYV
jgi:hypothetical protein